MGQPKDGGVLGAGYLQTKFKNVVKKRLHGALRKTSGKRRLFNERTLRLLNPPAQQGILKSDARARATRKLINLLYWMGFCFFAMILFYPGPLIL